ANADFTPTLARASATTRMPRSLDDELMLPPCHWFRGWDLPKRGGAPCPRHTTHATCRHLARQGLNGRGRLASPYQPDGHYSGQPPELAHPASGSKGPTRG